MLEKFKQRWASEESKLGKFFKYYIGYIGVAAGVISQTITEISGIYASVGVGAPSWFTKALLGLGIAGYVAGKITKKKEVNRES
jgi:hypothetical protein